MTILAYIKSAKQKQALAPLAVIIVLSLLGSGCATREDVYKVEERVRTMEASQRDTRASLAALDSFTRAKSEGGSGEYAALANLIESMAERIEQLAASVTDMQDRLTYIQRSQKSATSSTGATGATGSESVDNSTQANNPGIDCTRLYDDSFILVRQAEYESARAGFVDFLKYCGSSNMADNAQYWLSDTYYNEGKYPEARVEFQKLISDYPQSDKFPTAYYKLGRCAEEDGDIPAAKKSYQYVVDNYPSTQEAEMASGQLTELKGSAANRGD